MAQEAKLDNLVTDRLKQLLRLGDDVLATKRSVHIMGADDQVDGQLAHKWATSSKSLLAKVFGSTSEHYKEFCRQTAECITFSPANRAMGILHAAFEDFEGGYLADVRSLIEAEVFDDFLEQASHLLSTGYHAPAAVIAGCVLEDGLRKLCDANEVAISSKPKLDKMNADLAKSGVYNKLTQKKITMLADLRNKAAHGQWDDFTKEDVREMLSATTRILEEYLT